MVVDEWHVATGLADSNLFGSMILTPVSTAVAAVKSFVEDPKLNGKHFPP